jgi:PAS domain S-box-containing protein
MKLFQRTILSFFGIIVLQTALTVILVADSIEASQAEDAKRELKDEALSVFDNFNAWKRALWAQVVDLAANEELKRAIDAQAGIAFDDGLNGILKDIGDRTGAEFIIARSGWSPFTTVIPLSASLLPFPPERYFRNEKPHPYIEMVSCDSTLYFSGTVRVMGRGGKHLDLFILKRVDSSLCSQLTFNPRIKSLVSVGNRWAVGTIGSGSFSAWLDGRQLANSYAVIDRTEEAGVPYSAVVQQSGTVRVSTPQADSQETLYVATYLSQLDNRKRLSALNSGVITVSVIVAAITLLISLVLTTAVTSPIRGLRDAMMRIKTGDFEATVKGQRSGEIGDLLRGFNEMARQLRDDSASLSEYIAEIVRLKEYNDRIFNSIREGIIVVNATFSVEKANHAFLSCFHLEAESVVGRNIDELSIGLFDEPLHTSIRSVISGGVFADTQTRRTKGGVSFEVKFYPLIESAAPAGQAIHCILVIEDVSRKIAYEEKIFQAEKLASVSMLSAGVAHEINNPLSSILTNVQNLIDEDSGTRAADLRIIEQETKRIARIVRNLLDFSSPRGGDSNTADANAVISEVLQLIRYSIRRESRIGIELELGEGLPRVSIGEDELKQIVVNLIKNSLQAIDSDGTIAIGTRKVEAGIEIVVRDTGRGIDPEILPRIFDPFFTTKGDDGNTGLGLSVVYGIVTKYRGTITVESSAGTGTTMCIILPRA